MADGEYTTAQVARISGFSVRQLDYWVRRDIILPSAKQACGSGSRRSFTFTDLVHLGFIRHLRNHGWSVQKIRQATTILREVMSDPDPLKNAVLVDGKGTVLALCKTKEGEHIILDALNVGGQQVMAVVLEILEEDTRRIASIFGERDSEERDRPRSALTREPVRNS